MFQYEFSILYSIPLYIYIYISITYLTRLNWSHMIIIRKTFKEYSDTGNHQYEETTFNYSDEKKTICRTI